MSRYRTIALAFVLLLLAPRAVAEAPPLTAEAIVERHIEARGGEAALRAIQSLVFDKGVYSEPGYTSDGGAVMMLRRPNLKLVGHPERRPDFLEGFDGSAWEWYEDPGLTLRTVGPASAAGRHNTTVEGPFLDYAEKGSSIELVGSPLVGGRRTYELRLTLMDGFQTDYFFDAETFLIIASRQTAAVHAFGEPVTAETRYSDFRRVAGVLFPFRSTEVELATGRELNAMLWGSIEANRELPARWFSPPLYERTPIQTLMDQLFAQRDDAQAMLWTYREFRRLNPGVDTREAAEVIGYQVLKMGQSASAIALLERNAQDNPAAADSAFGLGRAYAMAGRKADARREFERALRLEPGHARATKALADLAGA